MPFSIKDNPMMLREIIMDHYQHPRNKKEIDDSRYITIHMDSASCIDDIYIHLLVENDIVKECFWHGNSCAISAASTSIMTCLIKGKSLKEAKNIMDNFNRMINSKSYDENVLGEAIAFINTNRQPSRIGCATIGWRGFNQALDKLEKIKNEGK